MATPYKYEPPAPRPIRETRRDILAEFDRWQRAGANVGRYDFPIPKEIGGSTATVRFQLDGREIPITCDRFDDYAVNLRCCWLAIQSMRLNDMRGIGETLTRAYAGLLPAGSGHVDPYEYMGIPSTMDLEEIEAVYRIKARRLGEGHPELKALNVAMDRIREDKR